MDRIKRIVYLIESPFNKRDYDRYGFEILQENGFRVEVWDCTPYLRPQVHKKVVVPDPIDYDRHYQFFSIKETAASLKRLFTDTIIICLVVYNLLSYRLFQAITSARIPYCVFTGSRFPSLKARNGLLLLSEKMKSISLKKVINRAYMAIPLRYLRLRCASFALVTGGKSDPKLNKMIGDSTEIILTHSFDYDIYLSLIKHDIEDNGNFALFLDEYLPFHSDYVYHNLHPFSSAERYYPPLREYFDYFESKYKLEVIIAGHPRSNYDQHPDYFNGRKVVRGHTAELVKRSKIVFLHCSTAVNFAVLFKKPTVFITSDSLNGSGYEAFIYSLASCFGKKPININRKNEYECEDFFHFDEGLYSRYKNQHIKVEGSEEKFSWQIFADRIKGIQH